MRLPEQVTRLGIVIAIIVAAVLLLRFVILPDSWFSARPHQAAKVEREIAKPVHYAGVAACRECHEEEFEAKYAGAHRYVGCENCHGPSATHAADEKAALPNKPREREFCLGCHAYQSARPNGFPQVDRQKHKPRKRCVSCHDAHEPAPDEAPWTWSRVMARRLFPMRQPAPPLWELLYRRQRERRSLPTTPPTTPSWRSSEPSRSPLRRPLKRSSRHAAFSAPASTLSRPR